MNVATLMAAAARILPATSGPGAAETRVGEYVAGALGHRFLEPLLPIIEKGLAELDDRAGERFGEPFASCAAGEQDELLQRLQTSRDPICRFAFEWLVKLCLEGFLCDPIHGGNHRQLGWRFVGYEREEPRSGFCLHGSKA